MVARRTPRSRQLSTATWPRRGRGRAGLQAGAVAPTERAGQHGSCQAALRLLRRLVLGEQTVQFVGLVLELAEVLELEAQHQGAVRLDVEQGVLDEGLGVGR